jgi:hypothetical protein
MNKTGLAMLLLLPLVIASPTFVRADVDLDLDLDSLDFNFDAMPDRSFELPTTDTEKTTFEKLDGITRLASFFVKKKMIEPMDETLAENPELFALTGISVYALGSWYGISSWKKMIYGLFPYLVLRGILKRIDQNKPA